MVSAEETPIVNNSTIPSSLYTVPLDISEPKRDSSLTPRKIKVLASAVYGNYFLGSCYALLAPFFPAEAQLKGATATQYGLVFGVFQLVMFLSAPVYGKLGPILRPTFLMKSGMAVSGACSILFGTLKYAPAGASFLGLAFAVRIVEALGSCAFLTSSLTVIACELPDLAGRSIAIAEASFSLGLATGPGIGGLLYEAGGYAAPFVVIGLLLLLGTLLTYVLLSESDANKTLKPASALKFLTNIDFLISGVVIFSCFFMLGFNEATLEPHIREFGLSHAAIGGIFVISGASDAISAPVWGICAEKLSSALYISFLGCLFFVVCFLIIGPVPFFHYPNLLWVVIVSQVFLGTGMGAIMVSSYTYAMHKIVESGFPDDVSTYSLVSGLLFSGACLGGFIGPFVGGFLLDHVGFRIATVIVVGFELLVTSIVGIRLLYLYLLKFRTTQMPQRFHNSD